MLRSFLSILSTLVAVLLTGCMQTKSVLTVNKDGSATLVQTMYGKRKMGDGPEMPLRKKEDIAAEAEAEAKMMGAGVTVKSTEALTDKAGWDGSKAVFSIADISKATLSMSPGMGNEDKLKFEYSKDDTKLTVIMPDMKAAKENEKPGPGDEDKIKEFFADFLVEFEIKVEGKISQTNATHPNAAKDGVLITRQDIGGIIKAGGSLKKVMEMKSLKDAAADPELKKFIQIETNPKVTIDFE